MTSLPLRPTRHAGEGAVSLMTRLAAANGFHRPADLCAALGLPWHAVIAGDGIEAIADAARCDVEGLRFDTGHPTAKDVALRGEMLGRRQWSVSRHRRVCPACVAEDLRLGFGHLQPVWARTWWDVSAVSLCPTHRIALERACQCGEHGDYVSGRFGFCTCHMARNRPSQSSPSIPCDPDQIRGDLYILGRLGVCERRSSPILDGLPLGKAISLMGMFGLCSDDASPTRSGRLTAGFAAFEDWPHGLHDRLNQIARSRVADGRWGAENAYGVILNQVRDLGKTEATAALRLEIARHAASSGIARAAKPVLGVTSPTRPDLTLSKAQRTLGIGHARARDLLGPQAGHGKGTPILLPSQVVKRLREHIDARADLKDLQASLGVGKAQTRSLVEAGLVPRGTDGKVATGAGDALIGALLARRSLVRGVPLPAACRRARTGLPDACKAILSGRLNADEIANERGLARVGVEVAPLRAIGKDVRNDGLTVEEAAAWLGEKWQVVRDLAASGLITRDRDGKLDRRSVDAFARNYVPGALLARKLGTSPKHLPVMAAARGVRPIIAPPGARKAFYKAADAARLG